MRTPTTPRQPFRPAQGLLLLAAGVLLGLACGFAIGLTKPRVRD